MEIEREKYISQKTKEYFYNMDLEETPKGVKMSYFIMTFPLIAGTAGITDIINIRLAFHASR